MAGKYFEDLEVGMHFKHSAGRTGTEMEHGLFSAVTKNTQPGSYTHLTVPTGDLR